MASQPPQQLPLFYKTVVPLSWQLQPDWGFDAPKDFAFAAATHAIPLTVDEFVLAQRHYPIVFGQGQGAAPLALVGLNEGRNLFVEDGRWRQGAYIPAYVRRYPFLLAKLNQDSEELSLCADEGSGLFGNDRGERLFDGQEITAATRTALDFCDQFEQAVQRTRMFMDELAKLDLVIDGEVSIQVPGREQPSVYRGFRMVAEERLREIRGDVARKLTGNGMLGIIYAHMFSLGQIRELFAQQAAPPPDA